jgi:hypothetical protein
VDPLVIVGIVVGLILAFVVWRAWTLSRSARAFEEGRRLVEKGDLTPAEQERLATLRDRCKVWGPEMDPTLTAVERLGLLPPGYAWLAQNVTGDEDAHYRRMYADGVTAFAAMHPRGCNSKDIDAAVMDFARAVFTLEADRLQKAGVPEAEWSEQARAEAARVCEHFFGDRSRRGPSGGWVTIAPPGIEAVQDS